MEYTGKILMLGCGSVAQCSLPLLLDELKIAPTQMTVLDMTDNRETIQDSLDRGVNFVLHEITPENLASTLSSHVSSGDVVLDLAWNIDCNAIIEWCHDNGVLYLNTSVEMWDPYVDIEEQHPTDRTLYVRHMRLRRMTKHWKSKGPTAVVEHGANPGLVSHFAKQALTEIADRLVRELPPGDRCRQIERALEAGDFARLAQLEDVKVIHIAERDTQITNRPKQVNEFVNTWSVEGFREEGIAPAELGWGTHEKRMPLGAYTHSGEGPGNQICLPQMGIKTWVRSWVPTGETTGMVVRHGEAFTLCDHLTVWEGDRPVYRPTVHYAYCPSDAAINSLHELEMRRFVLQDQQRIMNHEIISGRDELGVLLMGHDYTSWWTGSRMSIEESRAIDPNQSATTMQVAASVLAATKWMIANPNQGVCVPDDLPWTEILETARPFLGTLHSDAVDWDPLRHHVDFYGEFNNQIADYDDPWQFTNFLVS